MSTLAIIGLILIASNLVGFSLMGFDKRQSTLVSQAPRVPEGVLFCAAILFGSAGVLLGMCIFRHKIRKWYFQVGILFLATQHVFLIYLIQSVI